MLWAGVLPAIVIFYLMTRVSESPLWLEQKRQRGDSPGRLSLARLFDRDLRWVTLHTSLLMGAFVWLYQLSSIWYPTLVVNLQQRPLEFLLLLYAGGVIGSVGCGSGSEEWGCGRVVGRVG